MKRPGYAAACIAGLLVLIATWYAMFVLLAGMTEILLVPWDTTPDRPPVGTLARSVNDFFEDAPGAVLPAAAAVAVGVALLGLRALQRTTSLARLLAIGAGANALFVVLDALGVMLGWRLVDLCLPPPHSGYDLGYQRTWPGVVVTVLLLVLLFWTQWQATARPRRVAWG